ncbi:Demethylmenaquinone methyltransferase [Bacteroidales bacterium Barb6XT]|nr:Demethylmenaquinone methyltransferase [Bacteroidales bacterium Barb6XT]
MTTGYGSEKVLPYNGEEGKGIQIRRMFDSIAGTYDRLNHTLSFGFDKGWRRKGISALKPFAPRTILDIATGTGDMAIALCKALAPEHVTGADLSEGMMAIGRRKAATAGLTTQITFEQQDCLSLTYGDGTFDAVSVAFGVRNFEHIEQGIAEMYRVLKPGGHLMILELATPDHFPVKQLYRLYAQTVIPAVGRILSKEKAAYAYLPASVRAVPQGRVMADLLGRVGFTEMDTRTFTFGVCALYTGKKR